MVRRHRQEQERRPASCEGAANRRIPRLHTEADERIASGPRKAVYAGDRRRGDADVLVACLSRVKVCGTGETSFWRPGDSRWVCATATVLGFIC